MEKYCKHQRVCRTILCNMTTDWAQSSDRHQSSSTMSGNKGNEYVRRFRAKQEQDNRSI